MKLQKILSNILFLQRCQKPHKHLPGKVSLVPTSRIRTESPRNSRHQNKAPARSQWEDQTLECDDPQVNSVARTERLKTWKFNSWSIFPHDLLQTFVPPSPCFNGRLLSRFTKGREHWLSGPEGKAQGMGTVTGSSHREI